MILLPYFVLIRGKMFEAIKGYKGTEYRRGGTSGKNKQREQKG